MAMARIYVLMLSFVMVLHHIQPNEAAEDPQCETAVTVQAADGGSFPYDADGKTAYYAYYSDTTCTTTAGATEQFECADRTCQLATKICDGANDCPNGEDEVGCGTATCTANTCPRDTDVAVNQGEIVTWSPPTVISNYEVIGDEAHFPYTTFPVGQTDVYYRMFGPYPFHYCRFTVDVTAATAANAHCVITNCPIENEVETADPGASSHTATWTEPSSSVTPVINDEDHRPGNAFPIGYTRVVYTFSDVPVPPAVQLPDCFCIFYVIVKANPDDVGPTIDCPLEPITFTLDPPATTATVTEKLLELLDSVDDAISTTTSHDVEFAFPIGETQFVVTLADGDGNSHSCTAPITVTRRFDDIPPVISNCPASGVTVCYKEGESVVKGAWTEPTASDNILVKSFLPNIDPNNFLQIPAVAPFTSDVVYTATDWNDNEATCEFTLTFEVDTVAPIISNCKDYTEYTTLTTGEIVVDYPEPTVTDNCDQYQITVVPPRGTNFTVNTITPITYTVTDAADNIETCSFSVEVAVDTIPQFIDCPLSMAVSTKPDSTVADVEWSAPTVTDDNQLNADNVEMTITPGIPGQVLDAADDHKLELEIGVYVVTYSYSDVNLQKGQCIFTITVQDDQAPTFTTCPVDMERTLDAVEETIVVTWDPPTAVDNDGEEVTIEIRNINFESGSEFRVGSFPITYTAKDHAEPPNEALCSFSLTVNAYDTGNFWIGCPDNINEHTDPGLPTASVEWDQPEIDSHVDSPRFSQTHSPGTNFVIGDTRVEYVVFDRADNTQMCQFTVTVSDEEPPVIISCPGDVHSYGLTGRNTVPVFWPEPRTSDNSGSTVSLNASPIGPGSKFGLGASQVYYSAVDPSGNSISGCHFQVTVTQSGDTSVIAGSAQFTSIRGTSSTSAVAQASNLADDLDVLFRQNTAISNIIAGIQTGTPSPLSNGDLHVPFSLYLAECRASFLQIRDSLTQNLQGPNRDAFDTNNVIVTDTFQLNTKEFLISQLIVDQDLNRPLGDQALIYNGDYSNPRTTAYRNYEERVCSIFDQLFSAFTGYCGCALWQLAAGSIRTDVVIIFNGGSSVSQSALHNQIANSITGGNNLDNLLLENFDQTTVTEVCPETYCQNGGTCEPNAATYQSQCTCPTDYSGTQCQTYSGPDITNPTESPGTDDQLLTTEEIIGIVVGAVGGLLLIIILLACCCVFCLRPSEPKPQPIIQEPPEPIFSVEPPRRNVVVRDVLEPPPIPRPFPVRVPARIPFPIRQQVPVGVPQPVPRPFPVPFRQPVPFPVRVPVPVPQAVPRPVPLAIRQPVAVPNPIAVPRPVAVPVRTPIPVPQNIPIPVREQVPVIQPIGIPVASRQPLGPGLGNGFGSRLGPNLGLNGGLGLNNGLGLNGGLGAGFNGGLGSGLNGGFGTGLNGGFGTGLNGGFGTGLNGGLNGFNSTRF